MASINKVPYKSPYSSNGPGSSSGSSAQPEVNNHPPKGNNQKPTSQEVYATASEIFYLQLPPPSIVILPED